jgi:anti-sigma regulatory factor (Ser/Thr protein kinase)
MSDSTRQVETIASTANWLTLQLPCDLEFGEQTLQLVAESAPMVSAPLEASEKEKLLSAFREVLWNAIEHGGKLDAAKRIRIDVLRTARSLSCFIRDPGPGFRLSEIEHAAVNNPEEDTLKHAFVREAQGLRPGGFGILMAKAYVDELIYNERGNEAILIRYLDKA